MEKIIHQIWIGPYNLPDKERMFADHIRSAHPDFTYMFWDHVPQLPDELQRLVDYYTSLKHWVHIADLLRYYLVNEHGGIYIDCDYQLLNPIINLRLEEHEGFIPLHYNPGESICNSMFGFRKHHPIINAVCEKMKGLSPNYNHWLGPNFFGQTIKEHLGYRDIDTDVTIDASLSLQGIRTMHSRGEFKTKYLVHHYDYTWHPENQAKMTLK